MDEVDALHGIILNDDVPALRELLRLAGPDLLPTMVYATEMGRVRILEALLDYRDSLAPARTTRPRRRMNGSSGSKAAAANCHGVDPVQAAAVAEESKRRVAVVRMLLVHGA
ncbi:hypothetical protein SEUCBS139899_010006 [Sporothrix eucalyptigena]